MTDLPPTRVVIKGPFPAPTGLCGPDARKTESHVYQVWRDGRQLIGGTNGPDFADTRARALRLAAEKGLIDPPVIVLPPTAPLSHWFVSAN